MVRHNQPRRHFKNVPITSLAPFNYVFNLHKRRRASVISFEISGILPKIKEKSFKNNVETTNNVKDHIPTPEVALAQVAPDETIPTPVMLPHLQRPWVGIKKATMKKSKVSHAP